MIQVCQGPNFWVQPGNKLNKLHVQVISGNTHVEGIIGEENGHCNELFFFFLDTDAYSGSSSGAKVSKA